MSGEQQEVDQKMLFRNHRPEGSNKQHQLMNIIATALCAVICSADTWKEIEELSLARSELFNTLLELPHGIPSADTFARVFAGSDLS